MLCFPWWLYLVWFIKRRKIIICGEIPAAVRGQRKPTVVRGQRKPTADHGQRKPPASRKSRPTQAASQPPIAANASRQPAADRGRRKLPASRRSRPTQTASQPPFAANAGQSPQFWLFLCNCKFTSRIKRRRSAELLLRWAGPKETHLAVVTMLPNSLLRESVSRDRPLV